MRAAKEAAKPNRQRIAILVNQQSLLSSQNMGGMEKEIHVQEEEKAEKERIEKALLASKRELVLRAENRSSPDMPCT